MADRCRVDFSPGSLCKRALEILGKVFDILMYGRQHEFTPGRVARGQHMHWLIRNQRPERRLELIALAQEHVFTVDVSYGCH